MIYKSRKKLGLLLFLALGLVGTMLASSWSPDQKKFSLAYGRAQASMWIEQVSETMSSITGRTGTPSLSSSFTSPVAGNAAILVFELDRDARQAVTFKVNTNDISAKDGDDYVGVKDLVMTIPTGQRSVSLSIITKVNETVPGDKEFVVSISDINNAVAGTPTEKVVLIQDPERPTPPTLELTQTNSPFKGSAAMVVFTLDREPLQMVQFKVETFDISAKAGAEYVAYDSYVTIAPGNRTATVYIQTIAYQGEKGDLYFGVKTSDITNARAGAITGASILIIDTDEAVPTLPTVSISSKTSPVEGAAAAVTFSLDRDAQETVSFRVRTSDGTAKAGEDYEAVNRVLYILPGQRTASLNIVTYENANQSGDRIFNIALSDIQNANAGIPVNEQILIQDNSGAVKPRLRIASATGAKQGDAATVIFELDREALSTVTFKVSTSNITTQDGDFEAINNRILTIPSGSKSATLYIGTSATPPRSEDRQFIVAASDLTNAVEGIPMQAVLIIEGTDSPVLPILTMDQANSPVEGSSAVITFRLDKVAHENVSFTVSTIDGTAKDGINYEGFTDRSMMIVQGTTSIDLSIPTKEDNTSTGDLQFVLIINEVENANVGTPSSQVILIQRKENPTLPTLSIDVENSSNTPTRGQAAVIQFTLDREATLPVTFIVKTADVNAVGGEDYDALDYVETIGVGQRTKTLSIPTYDHANATPGDKYFSVAISAVSGVRYQKDEVSAHAGNVIIGSPSSTTVTIQDNDNSITPILNISEIRNAVEGEVATVVYSIDRSSSRTIQFEVSTADNTARSGVHYEGFSGRTVVIPAGQTSAEVNINTIDNTSSVDRNFQVAAGAFQNVAQGSSTAGTVNIQSSRPTVLPAVRIKSVSSPTAGDIAIVDLELDRISTTEVSFRVSTQDLSAIAGQDYVAYDQVITLPPYSRERTINITTIAPIDENDMDRGGEFTVNLSNFSGVIGGDPITEKITIDNPNTTPVPPVLSISSSSDAVAGTAASVTFSLSRTSNLPISFTISTVHQTTVDGDYTPLDREQIIIPPNTRTTSRSIQTNSAVTQDKYFTVRIDEGSVNENASLGSPSFTTITIIGNNPESPSRPSVTITSATNPIEGNASVVRFALSHITLEPVTFRVRTNDVTAVAGTDYQAYDERLTIPTGGTEAFAHIQTMVNASREGDRTFTVAISEISDNALSGDNVLQEVIIQDSNPTNPEYPIINISSVNTPIEGRDAIVVISLNKETATAISFKLKTSDFGSAEAGKDYDAYDEMVYIPANNNSATVHIRTKVNSAATGDRSFLVSLSELSANVTPGAIMSETITIQSASAPISPVVRISNYTSPIEGNDAVITFSMDRETDTVVLFDVSTTDIAAKDGVDYIGVTDYQVAILPGRTQTTLAIETKVNANKEGDRDFAVSMSNITNAVAGSPTSAVVIIQDGTTPTPPVLSIGSVNSPVEGNFATVTFTLNKEAQQRVEFTVSTTDFTAASPGDYNGLSNYPVVIGAGQKEATVQIATVNNGSEDDKQFMIRIDSGSIVNATAGSPTSQVIVIQGSQSTVLPILRIAD